MPHPSWGTNSYPPSWLRRTRIRMSSLCLLPAVYLTIFPHILTINIRTLIERWVLIVFNRLAISSPLSLIKRFHLFPNPLSLFFTSTSNPLFSYMPPSFDSPFTQWTLGGSSRRLRYHFIYSSFFGVSFLLGLGVLFYSWKRSLLISIAKLAEGSPV